MRVRLLAATAVLALAPLLAHAQGFVELGIGQSSVDLDELAALGASSTDEKDTTFAISGGYMFHPNIGAEIGYRDLGEASATVVGPGGTGVVTAEVSGFFFGLVGRLPVAERFSIVPRFGLFMWDGDVTGTVNGAVVLSESDDGTDPYFGIGAQYDITKQMHVGAHFARFDLDGDDVDVIELKVGFRF